MVVVWEQSNVLEMRCVFLRKLSCKLLVYSLLKCFWVHRKLLWLSGYASQLALLTWPCTRVRTSRQRCILYRVFSILLSLRARVG